MDLVLQKYYEKRLLMMGDDAWKDLVEDVEKMKAATNDINGIKDEQTLFFRKGELSIMDWIITLRHTSEEAYERLKAEDEDTK